MILPKLSCGQVGLLAAALFFTQGYSVFAASKGLVAYSQASTENEWRVLNTKEMEKAFKDAGYDFTWTNANADPSKQLSDIQDLLARKPVLLVLAPVEYEPLAPVPKMAQTANVPLLVVDRAIPGTPGKDGWIAMVTIDYVDTGERIAKDIVATLTKKNGKPAGKLLHVTGTTGASPVLDEQKGIDNVLKQYPDIKIVASCDGHYQREVGRMCTEDLLQSFPKGQIDGIIYDNDDEMMGGLSAIAAQGRDELIGYLWGKDGTVDGLTAILNGRMSLTVQTPPFFGTTAVKTWETYQRDGKVNPPLVFVDKESFDAHTPEHRARVIQRIEELKHLGVGCCYTSPEGSDWVEWLLSTGSGFRTALAQ
jgi:ABC-type sugar transport system substrate-binding protein